MSSVAVSVEIGEKVWVGLGCGLWTDGVLLEIGPKYLICKFFYEGSWVEGRKLPEQVKAKKEK